MCWGQRVWLCGGGGGQGCQEGSSPCPAQGHCCLQPMCHDAVGSQHLCHTARALPALLGARLGTGGKGLCCPCGLFPWGGQDLTWHFFPFILKSGETEAAPPLPLEEVGMGLLYGCICVSMCACVRVHTCVCLCARTCGCQTGGCWQSSILLPWRPKRLPWQQDGHGDSQEGQQHPHCALCPPGTSCQHPLPGAT